MNITKNKKQKVLLHEVESSTYIDKDHKDK